ncbi:hypothetical protein [Nakamurella panacisegetis]|nr:hypothetical protein [Nakamurella panacisegetis]
MLDRLPPDLAALAASQSGALLGSQITAALAPRGPQRLVAGGVVKKLWHNGYAPVPVPRSMDGRDPGGPDTDAIRRLPWPDPHVRLAAAALTLRYPVIACSNTAAQVHGFDLTGDERTHVLAVQDFASHLDGVVKHRIHPVRPTPVIAGCRVTDAAETAVRIAARARRPEHILAGLDAAMRFAGVDVDDFRAVADDLRIRGIRLVREVLPYADHRAESPGESWLRWVCVEAGFPPPTPQVWVTAGPGRQYRVDLGWDGLKVACEYDGVEFHTGAALTRDRRKYNDLRDLGWLAHGVTSSMIWDHRPTLVRQVGAMLSIRGAESASR